MQNQIQGIEKYENYKYNSKQNKKQADKDLQNKIKSFMSSTGFSLFMSILTIYTIFAIDIDKAFFEANASHYFSAIHLISISFFITEIVLLLKSQDNYAFKFYFWIDIFSTLTMFLQIIWIEDLMNSVDNIQVAISVARVTKASRLSKIGARSSKIMKLIRLVRLMKFFKKQEKKQGQNENSDDSQKQSRIQTFQMGKVRQLSKSERVKDQSSQKQSNPGNRDEFWLQFQQDIFSQQGESKPQQKQLSQQDSRNSQIPLKANRQSKKIIVAKEKKIRARIRKRKNEIFTNEIIQNNIMHFHKPEIHRPNVDPQKLKQIQEKWKQLSELAKQQPQSENTQNNTRVGQVLKDQIQKNIVLMVMGVIIIIPILSADTWFDKNSQVYYVTYDFLNFDDLNSIQKASMLQVYIDQATQMSEPLVYLSYPSNSTCCSFPADYPSFVYDEFYDVEDLRKSQQTVTKNDDIELIFSKKRSAEVTSIINIIRSILIILLLIFSSLLFIQDIQTFALLPLEKMNNTVQKVSKNPLIALQKQKNQEKEEQEEDVKSQQLDLQTNILENAILKITNLLAIGLGQLGTTFMMRQIEVQHNESHTHSFSEVGIEGCIEIQGIYVCLKIAHLTEITQHLRGKTISYVNTVSQIVHETTLKHGGYFCHEDEKFILLFWKLREKQSREQSANIIKTMKTYKTSHYLMETRICDLSVITFLKIIERLINHEKMNNFEELNQVIDEFDYLRVYASMHYGKSIYGPIGSNHKIQTKFISHDVEFTKFLCRLSVDYEISNIVTEDVYHRLDITQNWLRKIQQAHFVFPSQNQTSLKSLYTIDYHLPNSKGIFSGSLNHHKKIKHYDEEELRQHVNKIYKQKNMILEQIETKEIQQLIQIDDIQPLRSGFREEWMETWAEGIQSYYEEKWEIAKTCFYHANDLYPREIDLLSRKLIQNMNKYKGEPPQNWKQKCQVKVDF